VKKAINENPAKLEQKILKTMDKIEKFVSKKGLDENIFKEIRKGLKEDFKKLDVGRNARKELWQDVANFRKRADELKAQHPGDDDPVFSGSMQRIESMAKDLEARRDETIVAQRAMIKEAKKSVKEGFKRHERAGYFEDKKVKQLLKTLVQQYEQLCDAELQDETLNKKL
jgi:uncharacterized protein YqfA (UPF0365 family)